MRRLSAIIFFFLFFSCQNEKSSKKSNDKLDSNNLVSTTPNKIIDSTGFIKYWLDFRQAVLNSDTNKLITLSRFPIQTRGTFDGDPIIEYSKQEFVKVFNLFLKKWIGDGSSTTPYDIIKLTKIPAEEISHNQIRIGDMVFFLTNKKWKLQFLYFEYGKD
jgi:hypothetical protein